MTAIGALVRARPNPLRDTTAQKLERLFPRPLTPSEANAAQFCRGCGHRWHGLECRNETCRCTSAWVPPE